MCGVFITAQRRWTSGQWNLRHQMTSQDVLHWSLQTTTASAVRYSRLFVVLWDREFREGAVSEALVWTTSLVLRVAHCQQSTRSRKPYTDSITPFRQVVCGKFRGGSVRRLRPPWIRACGEHELEISNIMEMLYI